MNDGIVLSLNDEILEQVKDEAVKKIKKSISEDMIQMILYGSCARGDYTEDSDIDIAILVKSKRKDISKYNPIITEIATELAMKYFAIVNFVCLPYDEYEKNNNWYPYFKNIKREGKVIYG